MSSGPLLLECLIAEGPALLDMPPGLDAPAVELPAADADDVDAQSLEYLAGLAQWQQYESALWQAQAAAAYEWHYQQGLAATYAALRSPNPLYVACDGKCERAGSEHSESSATTAGSPQWSSSPSFLDDASPSSAAAAAPPERSTVMMRNLPNNYTRDLLVRLIDKEGFGSIFDLVYMPMDFTSRAGFGYAFVNLKSAQEAERFREHFIGFRHWDVPSEKTCDVSWGSNHQGIAANIQRYRNCPVMHESVPDEFKPALFANGVRIAFPRPTRKLRPPQVSSRRS